ncbi:MAG TPA: PQQ-dependent sugar dehydrogenase, partial [Candidatus Limnocylindria bacterium]|nr:PQQ-dependent sugar dehydrogenase [Candidatus Limnocylindria bacterium]
MRTSSATTARLACVALVSVLACSDSNPSNPAAPPPPPGPLSLRLEPVASGFDIPIFLTAPPGDVNRLFVVEKTGRIEIIKNGQVLATPFLSLVGQLALDTEQGLLGMAFDPNYSLNGTFYVCYTEASGGALRVVRYQVSSDPDVALTAPMGNILTQPDSYVNHNGGMIVFGADGMLYVGMGDGGGGGDPLNTGQNRGDLLGSILRLDVSGGGAGYAIPLGNPFSSPDRPEIWTFGLRNPWRFSFDRQT